jgi:membrane dipeptidase
VTRHSPWLALLVLGCASLHPKPEAPTPGLAPHVLRADLHMHLSMRAAMHPLFHGEPGEDVLASSHGQRFMNQVEAEALRRAGVRLILATVWPPPATRPGRRALGEALDQLEELKAFTRRHPEFVLVRDAAEARRELARGRLVLFAAIEGGEGIERVEDVDVLYAAGARSITLVHFVDNTLADALDDQFGPPLGALLNGKNGALTPLGVEAVKRMIQLGILIDVAHASERTIAEVLALTEQARVPLIASHTGTLWAEERTVSAPLARRIGAGGGLIGIGLFRAPFQATPHAERWEGFQPGTCDEDIAHWLHYAREAGPEAVMLGSDFNSPIARAGPGGSCPHGLRHTGDLPHLFSALETRGIARGHLDGSGARLLRVLEAVEARADAHARQRAVKTRPPTEDLFPLP